MPYSITVYYYYHVVCVTSSQVGLAKGAAARAQASERRASASPPYHTYSTYFYLKSKTYNKFPEVPQSIV